MLTMEKKSHEMTLRMDPDLRERLSVVAQVTGTSMNQLIVQAITETLMFIEGDPEYQQNRQAWLTRLQEVGTT